MELKAALIVSMIIYLVILFGIGFWARRRIHDEEDYLVAGRRLPFGLSTMTLMATWFGAGTLITATDEIRSEGLHVAVMEPYGAGLALILAGALFAKPLWEMKICTMADFWRTKFGPWAEAINVFTAIPSYVGWIAVQLLSLAGIIEIFFGIPVHTSLPLVAGVAMIYTLVGGMWSVTLTDAFQLLLVVIGLILLANGVYGAAGNGSAIAGFAASLAAVPPEKLHWLPEGGLSGLFGWINLLAVAALGNVAGQDLAQRIFSARSANTAKWACLTSGVLYLVFGSIAVGMALAATHLLPDDIGHSVLPELARRFLSPAMIVVFVLTLMSVVLSTLDSAILAPAGILAHNGLRRIVPARVPSLLLSRICVVVITVLSVAVTYTGKSAFELLEYTYALGFAGFFLPFAIGIYAKRPHPGAAVAAIGTGTAVWCLEYAVETDLPMAIIGSAAGGLVYLAVSRILPHPEIASAVAGATDLPQRENP